MKYMNVREAAERWGISPRQVQLYCTGGRIQGAQKHSGVWTIPEDTPKPGDPRRKPEVNHLEEDLGHVGGEYIPMPLVSSRFALGQCRQTLESFTDPAQHKLALAEYYYFTGRAEEAAQEAELLLTSPDVALRLSACWIYGYANLATGHIHLSRYALAQVRETLARMNDKTPPQEQALAACIVMGASVLLHLPVPTGLPPLNQCLRLLPEGLRYFAVYVQAHHAYLQEDYRGSLCIAETALALCGDACPIPSIYLHLVASMDYMSLKQMDQAREHLLAAWELARKDDLIEAFGEHHGLLGGGLEAAIKPDWPEDFKRIINITYRFSAGWRRIHNPDTGRDVADNLTTTEFASCMLAARDWTNQEIGQHMNISPNTVKTHISAAMQKLNITQRKDLKQFMLQ